MPLGGCTGPGRDWGGTGPGRRETRGGGPSTHRGQGTLQDGSRALSSFPFWRSSGAKAAEKHHRAGACRSGQGRKLGRAGAGAPGRIALGGRGHAWCVSCCKGKAFLGTVWVSGHGLGPADSPGPEGRSFAGCTASVTRLPSQRSPVCPALAQQAGLSKETKSK